jgi:hypothetical protein
LARDGKAAVSMTDTGKGIATACITIIIGTGIETGITATATIIATTITTITTGTSWFGSVA